MRSIWKGSIAFGLVNVPVKVYSATEQHDIRFHQVHAKDGGRIKYDRICQECGKSVQFADIDKAYDSPDGERVILTDDDFDKLPAAEKHEIPVLEFVPTEQIDPILYDKSYFLEPDSASPKAYVLLRETLEETERTALVHFTLRQKTRLAALRVRDDVLVIQTLLWPDEVRAAEFPSLEDAPSARPQEVKMATSLVESMSSEFDPTEYTDDYQIELRKLIDETLANGGEKVIHTETEKDDDGEDAEVVDLVAALQRSVEAAGKNTKSGSSTSASAKKTPAKKAPAKKAAAKKTAAKKSTPAKTADSKADEAKGA
ncbi:Ku protein [Rhodococcus sp. 06-470-2]|jgi:DNA end-binding protein Ku|uniref:non-homologous end joining protein Ku n=1 Tax=unclassified Rhodococcus (in: high G+C Gram-positive bacteria) TaxID=192944 RepID=UPI000B9C5580|nr:MULTISPECIES: Ku protein [unclassified Rhodococcus (in: high G+C Gram-positive bacteria)]OZC60882.1 Ku protein [Rhodococcus sp. 06-470-2]OZE05850.1 Ku protein [Rhodococcus sp. 05-2255-3B1]OZE09057.1 Ku protein [Rhodococcus sp. 05-2255-3C]OZE18003.1 Ku protein [Rhodococcus sp. 05-2255-2A2]OZE64234.1 Ku protein [Rhodococcus sp. 05-2221-1B]